MLLWYGMYTLRLLFAVNRFAGNGCLQYRYIAYLVERNGHDIFFQSHEIGLFSYFNTATLILLKNAVCSPDGHAPQCRLAVNRVFRLKAAFWAALVVYTCHSGVKPIEGVDVLNRKITA